MGDAFKKVQVGDSLRIPAETFNTFIDAAKDLKARQQSRRQSHEPRYPNSGVVKVRNASGEDRQRFDVLGLVSPIIDPLANLQAFRNEPALDGVKPLDPEHFGKFAILLEPAAAGDGSSSSATPTSSSSAPESSSSAPPPDSSSSGAVASSSTVSSSGSSGSGSSSSSSSDSTSWSSS